MDYSYIIDQICAPKTAKNIRTILPILVSWAKISRTNGTYKELINACGYERYSGFGTVLGSLHDVILKLSKETNKSIPTLNALVTKESTGLPSDGFLYVDKDYENLSNEDKRQLVAMYNSEAINYPDWDWILNVLGLKEPVSQSLIDSTRKATFGHGGEGEEHKALKLHVANNPHLYGITTDTPGETEHNLLSGDRLDVYFPTVNVAVEVKPSTSSEEDILRGIFQCIKYKAVLDAEAKHQGLITNGKVFLVLGRRLTPETRKAVETLCIKVFENVVV